MVLADGLRDVGRPVLLRIGYAEFNKPGALYQPSDIHRRVSPCR